MRESFSAWPRVLALFKLVREGSHHPDLPVTRYGGELFAPGSGADGLSQALAVFENASLQANVLPDADVHEMLKLLTRTTMRIRQGRSSTRTTVPVDFTDLSSEYIGILYEGLLDYELKTAPADDPVVFLATGDQPALPLSRLEEMDARALRALFASFKDSSSESASEPDEDDATAATEDVAREPLPIEEAADATGRYIVTTDERQLSRERAERWAREAVETAGLVSKRGKSTPERQLRRREEVGRKARQLVARIVLPGEWYLVRWGGTRKGSGSFYTRPGLTIPTVQRTLRPLAYKPPKRQDGTPNPQAPAARWTPRAPEQILALKVCDPACGSGSFPLAALRFLTDAVYAALQHHERIEEAPADRSLVRLLGVQGDGPEGLGEELIPCPADDERFEDLTKAVLRRYVVERCIYAVDLDPLAVELCRLSLWIETMDKSLPFGFLDHKVKCGNSLIGAWFDEFAHYPAMAWKNREGGDKAHTNGVHFAKDARGKAIKAFAEETLKPELKLVLQGEDLFQADSLALASETHAQAMTVIDEMHELPVQNTDERARLYRDELLASSAWSALKDAMDLWAACWFWPADEIDVAPSPRAFLSPSDETRAAAQRVAADMRFFHWELEYPDVFRQGGGDASAGFDAILGNPPWDIAKPVSKEFFSNIDPLYRSYGKQEAIRRQKSYFDDAAIEHNWLDYNARFRAQSNYVSYADNPFGDPAKAQKSQARFSAARGRANEQLHERWRGVRAKRGLRRFLASLPAPRVCRSQPVQALPGEVARFAQPARAARVPRAVGPLLRPRDRRAAVAVPGALPLGVAVRRRKPGRHLPDPSELQVQPNHRPEGREDRSDQHGVHAAQAGGLGARRGHRDAVLAQAGRAVQPEQPGHLGNPVRPRPRDPGEDLRQRRAPRRRRAGWVGHQVRHRIPHDERLPPVPATAGVGGQGLPARRIQPLAARQLAAHGRALGDARRRSDKAGARGDRAGGMAVRHDRGARTAGGRGAVCAWALVEAWGCGADGLEVAVRAATV